MARTNPISASSAPASPVRKHDTITQRERRAAPASAREPIEGTSRRCSEALVVAYEGYRMASASGTTSAFIEAGAEAANAGSDTRRAQAAALYAREASRSTPRDFGYRPGSLIRLEA